MVRTLAKNGYDVVGLGRQPSPSVSSLNMDYHCVDLTQRDQVARCLSKSDADMVIHLAGAGDSAWCAAHPVEALQSNILATVNLLEALNVSHDVKAVERIVLAGSAYEYGVVDGTEPQLLTESEPLRPGSPYAWLKALQTVIGLFFAGDHGLPIVLARTFNLYGPGQRRGIAAEFARRVIGAEHGLCAPIISLGNAHVYRDFLDVRDAATAYVTLATHPGVELASVYNVCSGQPLTLLKLAGLYQRHAKVPITVTQSEPSGMYPTDVLVGSNDKLRQHTGWRPTLNPEVTVEDHLNDERIRLASMTALSDTTWLTDCRGR